MTRHAIRWAKANLREEQQPASRFVSAGIAFMACSFVLVPGELLKQQLQSAVQPGILPQPRPPRPSTGSLQLHAFPLQAAWRAEGISCMCATESPTGLRAAAAHLWKTGGLLGFFQGYKATVIRDVPYTMMELGQSFPCDHESIVSARAPPLVCGHVALR
jgi:hypothetical protein